MNNEMAYEAPSIELVGSVAELTAASAQTNADQNHLANTAFPVS